jgi:cell wall-associated NlpC family hydrolase
MPFPGSPGLLPAISYAEAEGYWITAGGPAGLAAIMAAIATHESTLIPNIEQPDQPYATTGWGLWQITPGNSNPSIGIDSNLFDPLTNARCAVWKWQQQGLDAWTTYTSGVYLSSLQAGVAPVYVTGAGNPYGPTPKNPGSRAPRLGDTPISKLGFAGSIKTNYKIPVGFDPNLDPSQLIINGQKVSADVTEAISSVTLDRTITGASTLTITFEDPTMTIVNSNIAVMSAPVAPISTAPATSSSKPLPGQAPGLHVQAEGSSGVDAAALNVRNSAAAYRPTTCALTDGTTKLLFALVSVQKAGYTITMTFEDIIVNQLRYCFQPGGVPVQSSSMTRANVMAHAIDIAINSMTGDITIPELIYPPKGTLGVQFVGATEAAGDLLWGSSTNLDQDCWSFLVQAANTAQWRCFSTGTQIVFGPDSWLLSGDVAAELHQYQNGVQNIDFEWDIGQAESTATVTMDSGDFLSFVPGSVVYLNGLGVANGWWLVSDMTRELHLPDATLSLAQPQPALTEYEITAADNGATTTTPTTPNPGSVPNGPESFIANKAVAYALSQQRKPYITGGTGPGGYDCSGLMYASYLAAGEATFPRTSEAQFNAGFQTVTLSNLIPGDLVFYDDNFYPNPGHVVMYIGAGKCVQAMETGTNVQTTPLPGGSVGACRPAPSVSTTPSGA